MAKINRKNGTTSVILRVKIMDSASTTGAGKTGLDHSSAGLIIGTIADNEATTTRYRASSSELETITTLGTFSAPTSGKARFKEVDATNHPGLYEIHLADARWAVSSAKSLIVTLSGASGMAQVDAEIDLAGQVDAVLWAGQAIPTPNVTGVPKVDPTHLLGTAWLAPVVAGTPDVNTKKIGNAAVSLDANGYLVVHDNGSFVNGTLTSAAGAVLTLSSSIADATLAPAGSLIILGDVSTGVVNYRTVVSSTTSTITIDSAPSFTVAAGDTYLVQYPKNENVTQWGGSSLLPIGGKVIYVATSGNGGSDSNAGTAAAPKLTVNGAIAIASPGDTIEVGAGTFSGAVSNTIDRLTIVGRGKDQTIITHSSGKTLTNTGDYFECRAMSVRTTSTTLDTNQRAISDEGTYKSKYIGLYVIGWSDGFYFDNCYDALVSGCRIETAWDGIQSAPSFGTRIEGCYITGGGEYGSSVEARGICAGFGVVIERCLINMARTVISTSTGRAIAVQSDAAHVMIRDSLLIAKDEVEESVANCVAFAGGVATGATGTLENCYLSTVHGNSTKAKDIDASGTSAYVVCYGTRYNTSKVSGSANIYTNDGPLRPTTNARSLDVTSTGAAGVDWSNVENPTTTLGLSGTTIAWNAAWDAEVQSEVQDAIEVNHLDHFIAVADPGSIVANDSFLAKLTSKSATAAFSSYNNTTDSLEANRDNIGTAGAGLTAVSGGGGGTVDPTNVDRDHTWKFDSPNQLTSPNIISELIGFIGLLSMDLSEPIPQLSAIASVGTATFANISGTEPTVTSATVTANKKGVNILIDASAATAGTYTISVPVETTDSQTFVRKGRLTVS